MELSQTEEFFRTRQPEPMDAAGSFALLVPLVRERGELFLLYEVRSRALRRQPGEICFPGGKLEGTESPEECALRETWEELAIPASAIHVMGPLDFIVHRSGGVIYPVLGLADRAAVEGMARNPAEVEETFLVPLSDLWDQTPREHACPLVPRPEEGFPYEELGIPRNYPWANGRETVLSYFWGDRVIWGLTGRVTRNLIKLLKEQGGGGSPV